MQKYIFWAGGYGSPDEKTLFRYEADFETKSFKRLVALSGLENPSYLAKHGDIGTFIVRVQHRQNSSWQGRITWMEEDRTIQFRSVWEMIKLIESAVDSVIHEDGDENTWFPEENKADQ